MDTPAIETHAPTLGNTFTRKIAHAPSFSHGKHSHMEIELHKHTVTYPPHLFTPTLNFLLSLFLSLSLSFSLFLSLPLSGRVSTARRKTHIQLIFFESRFWCNQELKGQVFVPLKMHLSQLVKVLLSYSDEIFPWKVFYRVLFRAGGVQSMVRAEYVEYFELTPDPVLSMNICSSP